jgi:hypothetical protein
MVGLRGIWQVRKYLCLSRQPSKGARVKDARCVASKGGAIGVGRLVMFALCEQVAFRSLNRDSGGQMSSRDGVRRGHSLRVSRLVIPQKAAPLLECERVACVRSHAAAAIGFSVLAKA